MAATSSPFSLSLSFPSSSSRSNPRPTSLSLPRARLSASHSLSFSSAVSAAAAFPLGGFGSPAMSVGLAVAGRRRLSVVCEATTGRKPDSAKKRERQNEKRRLHNKAYKSEMRTRMKKVFLALEKLRKKANAQPEEIIPIEKLIAEAYSVIDKTVKIGAMHRNTGAHRKSRLARRKRAIEILRGWYVPAADPTAAA